jgi:hypothetical protein
MVGELVVDVNFLSLGRAEAKLYGVGPALNPKPTSATP